MPCLQYKGKLVNGTIPMEDRGLEGKESKLEEPTSTKQVWDIYIYIHILYIYFVKNVYIYIYTYIQTRVCIYIYIYLYIYKHSCSGKGDNILVVFFPVLEKTSSPTSDSAIFLKRNNPGYQL